MMGTARRNVYDLNQYAWQTLMSEVSNQFSKIMDKKKPKQLPKGLWEETARTVQKQGLNIIQDSEGIWALDPYMIARDILQERGYNISNTLFAGNMPSRFIASGRASKIDTPVKLFTVLYNLRYDVDYTRDEVFNLLKDRKSVSKRIEFANDLNLGSPPYYNEILRYFEGEIKDLRIDTCIRLSASVAKWKNNKIALAALKQFTESKGNRFSLFYDILNTFTEYTESLFTGDKFARLTNIKPSTVKGYFLNEKSQDPKNFQINVYLKYFYEIYSISLQKINQILPTESQINARIHKKLKDKIIILFKNQAGNFLTSNQIANEFDFLIQVILMVSESENRYISPSELSGLIQRKSTHFGGKLRSQNKEFSVDDFTRLYQLLTTRYISKIIKPRSYNKLENTHFKYLEYFVKYEQFFQKTINFLREDKPYIRNKPKQFNSIVLDNDGYPIKFSDHKVSKLQSLVLFNFQGGKDMETGKKFIDLYKEKNPDGLSKAELNSLSEEQLKEKVLTYIERHHWKTSLDFNKFDCRIRALVGLYSSIHKSVTGKTKKGEPTKQIWYKYYYERRYRSAILNLIKGKAPKHWDKQYQNEFNRDHHHGENLIGISYLYYYNGFRL